MAAPDNAVAAAPPANAGTDPDTGADPAPSDLPHEPSTKPRSFYLAPDGTLARDLEPDELARIVDRAEGTLWVDVDTLVPEQQALLEPVFDLHPLAAEDALNANSRVRVEEYPNGLFAIVRGVQFCDETDDPYDVETYNLNFFLRKNVLVTAHGAVSPAVTAMLERVNRSTDVLARGTVYLMHQMMDASVDAYFPVVDQIDEFVEQIEAKVFVDFDPAALRDIYQARRLVLNLRRQLAPQREVFNALANRPLPLIAEAAQRYFRDVYDHVMRIYDSLDAQRDLLGGALDSYLTQVNNRTGEATKALSVVATLSIPFVMVSGMWGMNFEHIPLSGYRHGFAIMMAIQLVAGIGLVWLLHRRRVL